MSFAAQFLHILFRTQQPAMRDVLMVSIVAGLVVVALFRPAVGVLGWTVISIMNPHRYTWHASHYPLAAAVAIATMIGLVITRDRRHWSMSPPMLMLLAFMVWMCITFPFSFSIEGSWPMLQRVMKIDLMIIIACIALTSRRYALALAWTLALSIGLYGVKGGFFTIIGGGQYRVWGPSDSFIEGNNELALALTMTIPVMRFLQLQTTSRWVKQGLTLAIVLSAAAALGSQSRGALLALTAMACMLVLRSGGSKVLLGAIVALAGLTLMFLMPQSWDARMATITSYGSDSSAMGRINAWWMAWHLASDHPLGGGFDIYNANVFARYAPNANDVHAAHSIYFQVLGEHGFAGLVLFLLLWFSVWRSAASLRRDAPGLSGAQWAADLGSMCQVSLIAYAVGGAFLSLAYFDLPYNLLVLIVVARRCVDEQQTIRQSQKVSSTGAVHSFQSKHLPRAH